MSNVYSGNPQLRPTQTDSIEAGYETKLAGLDLTLRGYFSRDEDAILERKYLSSHLQVQLQGRDVRYPSRATASQAAASM